MSDIEFWKNQLSNIFFQVTGYFNLLLLRYNVHLDISANYLKNIVIAKIVFWTVFC